MASSPQDPVVLHLSHVLEKTTGEKTEGCGEAAYPYLNSLRVLQTLLFS